MTTNVKMILDEVNARIKLAEAKTAEDPSNFDSFPGAEKEKPVPAEAKKPDPEVKEEGPASRTEVAGAEPGSDAAILNDHLYEADEPVLNPDKTPITSADAFTDAPNEVSKTAADILNIIKNNIKEKRAENDTMSLNDNILNKIASVKAAREAGAADALAFIKLAQEQAAAEEAAANEAAEAQGAADAEAAINGAAAAADAEAGAADADAEVTPEEVVQAVSDLVEEGQISEEEGAEVINNIVANVAGEADTAEDAPVDEEQIAEGIAQAIENGELTEEEAQQLVSELVDAGADEGLPEDLAAAEGEVAPEDQGAADAEAAIADAADAAASEEQGAADADKAVAEAAAAEAAGAGGEKTAEAISRYQAGFLQKCAEYGVDPAATAAYLQARMTGRL